MTNVQFTSVTTDEGQQFLTVFAEGKLLPPVDSTHPNFQAIKATCLRALDGESVDVEALIDLFDVAEAIRKRFERLSDRVAVKGSTITVDGDPIHGTLQEQILQFLDAGEDFAPLVEFYEKLLTNPLGDVREGLYDYINGQRQNGNFTITPEGDILGYKAMAEVEPEWREVAPVYVPSRRGEGVVNGEDVTADQYIEQVPGDIVEMPRSKVLHNPSAACGDGLHIGTFQYASTFSYGILDNHSRRVMLVKFSPRDIVSLPDNAATWKLRVCRYEVIGIVDEPLDVPLYSPQGVEQPTVEYGDHGFDEADVDLSISEDTDPRLDDTSTVYVKSTDGVVVELEIDDRVIDKDGDTGTVTDLDPEDRGLEILVAFDAMGESWQDKRDLKYLP